MKPKIVLLELTKQPCDLLANIFFQSGYQVATCQNTADISSYIFDHSIDYLVVNVNLPHPSLLKQINSALSKYALPVVMFAKSSDKSLTEEAIRSGINALVVDGFDVHRLRHVMDIAKARFDENQRLKSELQKLKIQLLDRKTIDKAKGILMKRRAIDETTAFDLIRKMAQDRKQNLAQVAKSIIDVDELLI